MEKLTGKRIEIKPNRFLFIPRNPVFTERNLATRVHRTKMFKSRKRKKQDFLQELKKEGII